jgi:hypothetical protein
LLAATAGPQNHNNIPCGKKNGDKSAANQWQNGGPSVAALALIGAKNV